MALLNQAGQTATGPMLYITVTPVDAQVDVNDCATLKLDGEESDLADENCQTVFPSDPCSGRMMPLGSAGRAVGTAASLIGLTEVEPIPRCDLNVGEAANALRISAGFVSATDEDMDALDVNVDERIDVVDAVTIIRTPCPPTQRGWYTFQGNRRHTGRVQSVLPATIPPRWQVTLPTPTGPGLQSSYDTTAGVIAGPRTMSDPDYPLLWTVTRDGHSSWVHRIEDTSTASLSVPPTVLSVEVVNESTQRPVDIQGSPLAIGDSVFVAGAEPDPEGTGGDYPVHVLRLDKGVDANNNPILTPTWHRVYYFPGHSGGMVGGLVYSPVSTVFREVATSSTEYNPSLPRITKTHSGGCLIIPVQWGWTDLNSSGGTKNASFLMALSLEDGHHVWGTINTEGYPVLDDYSDPHAQQAVGISPGGLPPFEGSISQNVAAVYDGAAHIVDNQGWAYARDLATGESLAESASPYDSAQSSPSIFMDKLFFGDVNSVFSLKGEPNLKRGNTLNWSIVTLYAGRDLGTVAATPAIRAEENPITHSPGVIFADTNANIFGVGTEGDPLGLVPFATWAAGNPSYQFPQADAPIYCSPIVAGPWGQTGTTFLGADDGYLYELDADTGAPVLPSDSLKRGWVDDEQLNGAVRFIAAYAPPGHTQGRLYALSSGQYVGDVWQPPTLYCFANNPLP